MSEWDQFPIASANTTAALPPQNNAWDAFPLANGDKQPKINLNQPEPSLWDETKAVAGKALTGVGYAAAAPEMAADMLRRGINWGVGQVVPGYTDAVQKADALRNQVKTLSTPAETVQTVDAALPQPKTATGKIAGAIAQSIPSTLALTPNALTSVPNALNAAVRYGAIPAAASEAAGQLTEGTALETPVRIGTSLLASGIMGMIPGGIRAPQTGPTKADIKAQADAAYDRVRQSNVIVDPKFYQTSVNNMFGELAQEGFNPTAHPRVATAISELEKNRGSAVTFQNLENMRRIAKDAIASNVPSEQFLGKVIVRHIDGMVDNLTPANTIGNNPNATLNIAADIKDGRKAWSQLRKSDTIDKLQERAANRAAQYSNSGEENALRVEFRNLAQNEKKMRLFSKEEQDAIRRVARGGFMENTFRDIGKWSPTSLGLGPVSSNLGAGFLLSQLLGPAGFVIPPIAGAVSKSIATHMTRNNAELANQLMRGGPIMPPTNPSGAVLYNALMQGK